MEANYMAEDEISHAFEEISVEDFLRDTSAADIVRYGPEYNHVTSGRNNFNGFVDAQLRRSKEQADKHNFHAFSTLHSPLEQRHFHPDDDETAQQYAKRLEREAQQMNATWFFNAFLAPGRAYFDGDDPPEIDADDPVALREAIDAGHLHVSICWFARSIEPDDPFERSGIVTLDSEGHTTDEVEGLMDPESNPFHYVIGDHA